MKTALEIIEMLEEETRVRKTMLEVLEDGETLAAMGIEDEDQAAVEEAYEIIRARKPEVFFEITREKEFDAGHFGEGRWLTNLGGCSDNGNEYGLGDWQYEIDVTVTNQNGDTEDFTVAFQPSERNSQIECYSGYKIAHASGFGCDADESDDLLKFCDYDESILVELQERAQCAAEKEYDRLIALAEAGDVVAAPNEGGEIEAKFLRAKAESENCVMCVYQVGSAEVEVEWCNIHPGTGEIGEFDLQNSAKSSNSDMADRVEAAIREGETDDNRDIDLYLTIRDSFDANDCAELVEETFG